DECSTLNQEKDMKIRTRTTLCVLLGLLLCLFAVSLAQDTKTNESKKQNPDSSSMASCCCAKHGDSASTGKSDNGWCCCDESCEVNMKDGVMMKDHETSG